MPGLGLNGFIAKTAAESVNSLKVALRAGISKTLAFDPADFFGSLVNIMADEVSDGWAASAAAANAIDPDNAHGPLAVSMALLQGVKQNPAAKGSVLVTCNFEAAAGPFAPGDLIANVVGNSDNRWVNINTESSVAAGDYTDILFESETPTGSAIAPAGTLSVISATQTGWNSVTNPADATPGRDIETVEALKLRREQSIGTQAKGTVPGIKAAIVQVPGVIQAEIFPNLTQLPVNGVPPGSSRPVVWDGNPAQASNDAIAQALLDTMSAGPLPFGAVSGNATNEDGELHVRNFDRAVQVPIYVECVINAPLGADTTDIKNAIIAALPAIIAAEVNYSLLASSPFQVTGVKGVTSFFVSLTPAPSSGVSNIPIATDAIALLDPADIGVTIA